MENERNVDAVVLVGGQGTRLRPLTLSAPKPMLPTAGVPFLEHLLSRIREAGITHVVLGTSYRAETFSDHFGDGSAFGLEIEYVVEEAPLGTGGAIRNVFDRLRADDVMIFNGDILSGVDLGELLATHRDNAADVTLHLVKVADPRAFGCVPTDADGRVEAFLEKTANPPTDQINAGCYVFRREVIEGVAADTVVSVERETFPGLLSAGAKVMGHVDSSYWLDLGTPLAFVQGSADLVRGIAPTAALSAPVGESLVMDGATVADDARIIGGTTIGAGAQVGAGALVDGSIVFGRARIGDGARITRSVIGTGAVVGARAVITDAVIGDDAIIGADNELISGVRVWPGVSIPDGGVRFSAPS
ncbi:mannose-1-phosphate guanylyltransferase [Nakamurella panacisegetis]|uniref:Mannose-1-phosphate guanylyltransferase n=1 Tax=Nakamurella panacisegetis TaxID=1090615 RepID=A0A1H0PJY2_9ACTN|nr:NDP-sugar synthase [Nakamurella panacisegetis]SDP04939.1 mannose-1-phosphate guanylyltransferase [Nakamurella panacisegetis]